MDVKWFFVVVAILLTTAILIGMYFISLNQSLQDRAHFEQTQQSADKRFDNSTLIHESLFRNITDLKKGLDPIIAIIPNATKADIERQVHYNQTAEDFDKIKTVLEIKLQDHKTLGIVNNTVNEILGILKNETSSSDEGGIIIENVTPVPTPTPLPVPAPNNNNNITDDGIIIENITTRN